MEVGETYQGRYKIQRVLGEGGMGKVFQATDLELQRLAAIKVLTSTNNPTQFIRFQQEAKTIAKLSHSNIVQIFDFHVTEGSQLVCIMEMLEGESLSELLDSQGSLSQEEAVTIGIFIARGLRHAHAKGIVHRDIKPQNVMVKPDEDDLDNYQVKLVDFGVARLQDHEVQKLTKTGSAIGTPAYMSPESIRGEETDILTDIYSFGCTFYQMLTGKPPFVRESVLDVMAAHLNEMPPSLVPESSTEEDLFQENERLKSKLEKLYLQCMEKDKSKRLQSTNELLDSLEDIADDLHLEPPPADDEPTYAISKTSKRNMFIASGLVILLIAFLVPSMSSYQLSGIEHQTPIRVEEIADSSKRSFSKSKTLQTVVQPFLKPNGEGSDSYTFSFLGDSLPPDAFSLLLEHPKIASLTLQGIDMRNADTSYFERTNISHLNLNDGFLNAHCMRSFAAMPNLRGLTITGCTGYTEHLDLLSNSTTLGWVMFNKSEMTDEELVNVGKCKSIVSLGVGRSKNLTGKYLADPAFKGRLYRVYCERLSSFDSKNLRALKGQPLAGLVLGDINVDETELKVLSQLPLENVSLHACNITGKTVLLLQQIKTLQTLTISKCPGVKAEDIAKFKVARPTVALDWMSTARSKDPWQPIKEDLEKEVERRRKRGDASAKK